MSQRISCHLLLIACLFVSCYAAISAAPPSRKVTIVFTGDTLGIVEPCGCQKGMLGGLPRRATLLKTLRKEEPKLLLLDAGNLLGPTSEALVARLFGRAYQQMGYHAVALGEKDTHYPATLVKELKRGPTALLPATGIKHAPLIINGIKISLVRLGMIPTQEYSPQQIVLLKRKLAAWNAQSDLTIILSNQGRKQDEWLAKQGIVADILIGNQQWRSFKAPLQIHGITIVPTSWRGEQVGRLDLTRQDGLWQVQFRRYDLDEKIADDAKMARLLQDYYDEIAKRLLSGKASRSAQVGYGVASACAFCHRPTYRRWQKTKHAQALQLLKKKHREKVPECLSCHSEYYRRTKSAPQNMKTQGVECAACHGDGIMLILRPSQAGKAARPTADVCRKCHTPEKSPKFDFEKYKVRIKHW